MEPQSTLISILKVTIVRELLCLAAMMPTVESEASRNQEKVKGNYYPRSLSETSQLKSKAFPMLGTSYV